MEIIENAAEEQLYETLRQAYRSHISLRCLYIEFSKLEGFDAVTSSPDQPDSFENLVSQALEDPYVEIFICNDHDVFILSRVITHKRRDALLTLLSPKLGSASSLERLTRLFEISVDWSTLQALCEDKIAQLNPLDTQPLTKPKHRVLLPDSAIVASIGSRRAAREKPEVMVVEDDVFSQRLIANILEEKYSHTLCKDGQEALMQYPVKAPDVLFLDIGLPDIDGMEILRYIFDFDPEAYVVMFSGNGDREHVLQAMDLGARGFVGKPFTQDKVLQYITKSPFVIQKKHLHT